MADPISSSTCDCSAYEEAYNAASEAANNAFSESISKRQAWEAEQASVTEARNAVALARAGYEPHQEALNDAFGIVDSVRDRFGTTKFEFYDATRDAYYDRLDLLPLENDVRKAEADADVAGAAFADAQAAADEAMTEVLFRLALYNVHAECYQVGNATIEEVQRAYDEARAASGAFQDESWKVTIAGDAYIAAQERAASSLRALAEKQSQTWTSEKGLQNKVVELKTQADAVSEQQQAINTQAVSEQAAFDTVVAKQNALLQAIERESAALETYATAHALHVKLTLLRDDKQAAWDNCKSSPTCDPGEQPAHECSCDAERQALEAAKAAVSRIAIELGEAEDEVTRLTEKVTKALACLHARQADLESACEIMNNAGEAFLKAGRAHTDAIEAERAERLNARNCTAELVSGVTGLAAVFAGAMMTPAAPLVPVGIAVFAAGIIVQYTYTKWRESRSQLNQVRQETAAAEEARQAAWTARAQAEAKVMECLDEERTAYDAIKYLLPKKFAAHRNVVSLKDELATKKQECANAKAALIRCEKPCEK